MTEQTRSGFNPKEEERHLVNLVSDILDEAKKQGADACEVGASVDAGLSVNVRMGNVETVEFNRDKGFGITVYFGKKKGTASTSDSSLKAVRETVKAACDIAGYATEDPCAGLADADLMATDLPDLDLYYPWDVSVDQVIDQAVACEKAGLAVSEVISNSEGGSVGTNRGCRVYGNSHGFLGSHISSRHSISAVLIAQKNDEMQRDYWYSTARDAHDMEPATQVGEKAAQRTLSRLGARKIKTTQSPVVFSPEMASGLLSYLLAAISGNHLYQQSSFLLDHLGRQIFPDWVHIHEKPRLKKAMGSACFDNDGLPTYSKDLVREGVLDSYLLGTYSARKLGMKSTANAGGVNNVFIDPNAQGQASLLKQMGTGLLVTELMGQGVNIVTGDYSRGAGGFWVENGEIQYPVSEVTIAGNLKDMFRHFIAAGNDIDYRGNILSGSLLLDGMTIAGE
ncbi:Metalloprotease PmbA [invertebrate metagenome]|uniref:Metalloprotease PmbA n=1 Tax=invertebrate metagenome TaxID=1711999 RepID=A0A2H9TCC9_9ZZZZ